MTKREEKRTGRHCRSVVGVVMRKFCGAPVSDVDMLGEELFVGVVIVEGVGARVERRVVEVVAGANKRVGAAVHRVDDRVGEGVVVLRVRVMPGPAADAPPFNRRVNQSSGKTSYA